MADWSTSGLRVALTGAAGFLGQHVRAAFEASGADVTILAGDVCLPLENDAPVDVVCHLAARTGARFWRDPQEGVRVNVMGTLQALELSRRHRCRLVLASSCAVYRPHHGAVDEEAVRGPVDQYGLSKYLAELQCESYALAAAVPIAVLRLFNPYGFGQSDEFLIPSLCQALRGSRPFRLRYPNSVRDFVHVSDVAEVIRRASICEAPLVLNVGSGVPSRVIDVARTLAGLAGSTPEWEPINETEDPYGEMWADVERMRAVLGWSAAISIEQGLGMTFHAEAECDSSHRSGCGRR